MDTQQIVQLVGSLGFPIVVAGWFMLRLEKILKEHSVALQGLTKAIWQIVRGHGGGE